MPRLLRLLILPVLFLAAVAQADEALPKILIADPFIELHTGPGRGYPIFHVAERGQEVEIVKRRTDWFMVRTSRGVEGWVPREQMIATLEPTGEPLDLQEPARENYMSRRWQAGVNVEQNFGRLAQGSFVQRLWQLNLTYSVSPNLVLTSYLQYDTESQNVGNNMRLRWTIKPGNEFFIVWNRGWKRLFLSPNDIGMADPRNNGLSLVPETEILAVKLRWTIRK